MQVGKVVRNVVVVVLFGLLIISFAIFGVTGDVLKPVPKTAVAVAGNQQVSAAEYSKQFDRAREEAVEQIGRAMTVDEAIQQQVDRGLLQQMLDQSVLAAIYERMGVKVSPKVVASALRDIPAFFDPVTGRFDTKAYQDRIGQLGYADKRFQQVMSSGIAGDHFAQAMQSGVTAPLSFGALQGAVMLESREASGIFVTPALVGAVPEPTEAQLRSLLTELTARYQRPERRELTFARLSASRFFESAVADPEQVQKLYDFRKGQAATAETRTVVQIPVKDAATGQTVSQRLAKGEDPDAVAKAAGSTVVRYDAKPKSALPDRKIADAAFSLPAGQTSGAIQGDLGLAVVKVLSVTAGSAGDTSQLRQQIEEEVKARDADAKVSAAADAMEDAIGKGANLEAAAAAAGVPVTKTPAIDRGGRGDQPMPVPGLSAKLMQVAFAQPAGATSEFETEQAGEYFIVRVDKITPPSMPPFEEVRTQLTADFKAREMDRRLAAKANEIAGRLRKGEAIDAVAKAAGGAEVIKVSGLSRANAGMQAQSYGQEIIGAVLQAKKGEVQVATLPNGGRMVLKVDSVTAGDPTGIARGVVNARGQFEQQLQQDLGVSFVASARSIVKGRSYLDRARQAIGGPAPEAEGKAGEKADAKAKDKG